MTNQIKRYFQLALITIICLSIVAFCFLLNAAINEMLIGELPEPVPVEPFSAQFTSPSFDLIWEKNDVYVRPYNYLAVGGIPFTAYEDHLIFLGNVNSDFDGLHIEFLDIQTGLVDKRPKAVDQRVSSIVSLNDTLYLAVGGTLRVSGTTRLGASQISAYDIASGAQLWETTISGARSIERMVVMTNTISVEGDFSDYFYVLDSATGDYLKENEDVFFWFDYNGLAFEERFPGGAFTAVDSQLNVVWESPRYAVIQPPIVRSGVIISKIGSGDTSGRVIALDPSTGETLWQYSNMIGTISASNDVVYMLTKRGGRMVRGSIIRRVFETTSGK